MSPSGHTTGLPAPHETMSQSWVPARPAFGQRTTQLAPAGHAVWHGPLAQAKWQTLPAAQVHVPFAHVPSHVGFDPWQVTWHGGAPQANEQLAPSSHVHSPFAHVPLQVAPEPQSTWHGGLWHEKSHDPWASQTHVPLEQSLEASWWPHPAIAAMSTATANATRRPISRPAARRERRRRSR